ncbi:MAG TPA: ABC transporter ATP-binding protein [Elusimicrobiota bacterium]|nr:ABC transporter ATP-binding protein [Elusimicrobiota bacterium]
MADPLLKIENLSVDYRRHGKRVHAVRDVSLELNEGETLGVVGESGCGKSTLAMAVLRLLPDRDSRIPGGKIFFRSQDLLALDAEPLRRIRGGQIAVIFQDPFSALNPVLTVGDQLEESMEVHGGGRDRAKTLSLLERVRLPDPERIYRAYPHQISGGQRQRACLALAIANRPALLIADEPTTALDVTLQKEILDLLDGLRRDLKMAILFITHNMGLVSQRTDRLAVMYAGEIVERGKTADVMSAPLHPYTAALLRSLPRLHKSAGKLPIIPGQPPDLSAVPGGCPFHPRCPRVFDPCAEHIPALLPHEGRSVSCHLYHSPVAAGR